MNEYRLNVSEADHDALYGSTVAHDIVPCDSKLYYVKLRRWTDYHVIAQTRHGLRLCHVSQFQIGRAHV